MKTAAVEYTILGVADVQNINSSSAHAFSGKAMLDELVPVAELVYDFLACFVIGKNIITKSFPFDNSIFKTEA